MQVLDKCAEALFAYMQGLLGSFSVRDVADRKNYVQHFPLLGNMRDGIHEGPQDLVRVFATPSYNFSVNGLLRGNRTWCGPLCKLHFSSVFPDGGGVKLGGGFARHLLALYSKDLQHGAVCKKRFRFGAQ